MSKSGPLHGDRVRKRKILTIIEHIDFLSRFHLHLVRSGVTHKTHKTHKKPIKDLDGDGSISPEELIQILTSLGESPGDLNLYFAGMATDTTMDYRPVVTWLTFLLKHSKSYNMSHTGHQVGHMT